MVADVIAMMIMWQMFKITSVYNILDGRANLYMEEFEVKATNTSPHPPYLWKIYVDDTFTIIIST